MGVRDDMSLNRTLQDVVMPQLAESLVSATIGKWLKKPGDPVEQYEPICEVITDKVNAEIPSTLDGVMGELLAEEGQEIEVGAVICRIETAGAIEGGAAASGTSAAASAGQTAAAAGAASDSGAATPLPFRRWHSSMDWICGRFPAAA